MVSGKRNVHQMISLCSGPIFLEKAKQTAIGAMQTDQWIALHVESGTIKISNCRDETFKLLKIHPMNFG
jgi:hypothetical protein